MKKLIAQLCTISILATSLNYAPIAHAKGSDKQEIIRDVLANYSLSMERAEGSIKSLSEAVIKLREEGVTSEQLVDYIADGMEPVEAAAYRVALASRQDLVDVENMPALLEEVNDQMSRGSNYRGCSMSLRMTSYYAALGSFFFFAGILAADVEKNAKDEEIKKMRLEKTDLESDVQILIGEGVKPESYLISSIKKDIAYLDVQLSQAQDEYDKASSDVKKYTIITAASGAVFLVGVAKCSNF